jgi:peptidoglycan/LPS O-acetylase OafA/YrhL
MTPAERRIPALDGLRALAIVLVLLRHSLLPFDPAQLDGSWVQFLFANGWIGVDLFFVLSGFLIARSLLDHPEQSWTLYLKKRAWRILPAYYAACLLALSGLVPLYQPPSTNLAASAVVHFLILQDYLGPSLNVAFWSLGVEEKFYLALPLVLFVIGRANLQHGFLAFAILIGIAGTSPALRALSLIEWGAPQNYYEFFRLYRSPFHTCLEPLFFGVIIAVAGKRYPACPLNYARLLFWGGSAGLFALMFGGNMMAVIIPYDIMAQPTLIALVMAMMVAGAVYGGAPVCLGHTALAAIARLSFSLYLVHIMVLALGFEFTAQMIDLTQANFYGFFALFLPVYLALATLLALALYYGIEKPGLRYKDRLG